MNTAEAKNSPTTVGDTINELFDLRERKKELNQELKEITERFDELKFQLIDDLDKQGTTLARSAKASASITESEVPSAEDWDLIQEYVRDTDSQHIYERRLSAAAWREMKEAGEIVPGTVPFIKRDLSLRKV